MSISFGGMASGLDTNNIIKQLMYLEEAPIRSMQRKQKTFEQQTSVWQKVNTSLDTFKNKMKDLQDIFDQVATTSSDEDILTATADSNVGEGSYQIEVNQLAQAHSVASTTSYANSTDALNLNSGALGSFKININGVSKTIDINDGTETDSLTDIKGKINETLVDADGNQLAQASIIDNKLVLDSVETGKANAFSFDDTDGMLKELGVINADDTVNVLQEAKNADLTVNGLNITDRESNQIDDIIEGVTLKLKEAGTSTVTVGVDKEGMIEKINEFVTEYNSLQDTLDQYGDKEGALQGDYTLRKIDSSLYDSVIKPVENAGLEKNTLSLIGVEVDRYSKLSVDESKLEENIDSHLADIKEMFANEDNGIINRTVDKIDMAIDKVDGYVNNRIKSLEDQSRYIDDDIIDIKKRLEIREEGLRRRFTRMEQALSSMQNQGSWLTSQIGSMGLNNGMM